MTSSGDSTLEKARIMKMKVIKHLKGNSTILVPELRAHKSE
jgi:hypothetical protein